MLQTWTQKVSFENEDKTNDLCKYQNKENKETNLLVFFYQSNVHLRLEWETNIYRNNINQTNTAIRGNLQ